MKNISTTVSRYILLTVFSFCCFFAIAQVGYIDTAWYQTMGFDNTVIGSLVQPDSTIIVWGNFTRCNERHITRIAQLYANGSNDYNFNPGTGFNAQVNVVIRQSDGKFIVGGGFTQFNGSSVNTIVRLNTNGSIDTSFHGPTTGTIYAAYLLSNGEIIVGGAIAAGTSSSRVGIERLKTNGTRDSTFSMGSGSTNMTVYDFAVQSDGKYVISGTYTARIDTNGIVDSTYTTTAMPGSTSGYAMAVLPNGESVMATTATSLQGTTINGLAKFKTTGAVDTAFHTGTGFGISSGPLACAMY